MFDIVISIVTFNNNLQTLKKAISSCLATKLNVKLVVVDNSRNLSIRQLCDEMRIEYLDTERNVGFGAGQNIAIRKYVDHTHYHAIVNPDIYFNKGTLEALYLFAQSHPDIGLLMPKIVLPDNSLQYMCKLLPNPLDFAVRRFIPLMPTLLAFFRRRDDRYTLRFADHNKEMEAPFLSGCFMFIRAKALKEVDMFDERFFMYLEDVDLCRRILGAYRNVYYPGVSVIHECERGSTKNLALLRHHIISAIKYFNKWGWLIDRERVRINKEALQRLQAERNE